MKKLGILTFQNAINYGASLQAYSLQTFIQKNYEYDVEIVNYQSHYLKKFYSLFPFYSNSFIKGVKNAGRWILTPQVMIKRLSKKKEFKHFWSENYNLSQKYSKKSVKYIGNIYDKIIVGSDQVWNPTLTNSDPTYYLSFVKDKSKIKSYSASFGNDGNVAVEKSIHFLKRFSSVNVREQTAVDELRKHQIFAQQTIDPTLLFGKNFWNSFYEKKNILKVKYVLIYIVAPQTNLIDFAIHYARQNKCEIVTIGECEMKYKHKEIIDMSPRDFVGFFANAFCVFTTSYHGFLFAVNLNIDLFYELSRMSSNNNSRIIDLSNILCLNDCEIKDKNNVKKKIEWNQVNLILKKLREKSINILNNMLE